MVALLKQLLDVKRGGVLEFQPERREREREIYCIYERGRCTLNKVKPCQEEPQNGKAKNNNYVALWFQY